MFYNLLPGARSSRFPVPFRRHIVSDGFFESHRSRLEDALNAIATREYWSAFSEVPSGRIYGETAKTDGIESFKARLGAPWPIEQPGTAAMVGQECSPYGMDLGVTYPSPDLDQLCAAAAAAMRDWKRADVQARTGVCLEILDRLNRRSFEMANAVMHTTGQGFMMAFQAGGPHAQDRGLEAVAYAYAEMTRTPASAIWTKQVSKTDSISLAKDYRIVPRGVAVTVGCSTFPTWNSYPGIFASLATGNSVVVKPHPGAVLPLAITVEVCREVIAEAGFDPNLVLLACDTTDAPITAGLVTHPEVRIVDYTGGNEFGDWVEANARQAVVFTEKAGVNAMILDGIADMRAVSGNLAFSLCLYSGQMCTTPQNIYIPEAGIETSDGTMSFDDVAGAIIKGVDWLLSEPARASEILGAVQNPATIDRVEAARSAGGTVLRDGGPVDNEHFPEARTCSPLIIQVDEGDDRLYQQECFGPIIYIVRTRSTARSIELAADAAHRLGALTCGLYSLNDDVIDSAVDAMSDAGVALSCNLTGQIYVNQSAAFSDFHVSGANPAGNATLCDGAFVASRFRTVASRIPVPASVEATT
jgi:phenylacetic acid degradation protein paaN